MPVTFQPSNAQYLDEDGNPIDADAVIETENEYLAGSTGDIAALAVRMANKEIGASQFGDFLWTAIKDAYIVSYLFGRGGLGSMTQQDWGSIGGSLAEQRRYLNRFVEQLADTDMVEGTIRNRAQMYINSSREAFERGRYRAVVLSGVFSDVLWELGAAEHCADCTSLNARGWMAIENLPTYPAAGATECKSHCKCHLIYR